MNSTTLPRSLTTSTRTLGSDREPSESKIDRDSHFNGLYETKQNLCIEGLAEGEIQCNGTLTVADGARVKAKVTASTVTIAGELEGEVVCHGVFQIMPSGQVEAMVSARRLIVQEGGVYNGEFHMIAEDAALGEIGRSSAGRTAPKDGAATGASLTDPDSGKLLSTDEWWKKMTGKDDGKDEAKAATS